MTIPVTATIKIAGPYAALLREEAANRRMSLAALAAEYAMRGMDAVRDDDGQLAGFERRIGATVLAARSDMEAVQAELDTVAAMLDTFVKLMLVHLPEPGGEKDAARASAISRYEKYIQTVASAGFDGNRPQALKKIGQLIQARITTAEGNL